jgi:hypothetical protein
MLLLLLLLLRLQQLPVAFDARLQLQHAALQEPNRRGR